LYTVEEMEKIARLIRCDTLKAIYLAGSGHPGGCLSAVDILTALYFYKLRIDPKNPAWADRDRFLLGKGHAAPALFAALAHRGFFDISHMKRLRLHDGMLQATPNLKVPGADFSSGSLGQNLSVGVGMALAGRIRKQRYKTYVLLGDGELQEGQIWEAAMAASHYRLGNLVAILDNNHIQLCDDTRHVMSIGDPEEKFKSFGWNTTSVNGHDIPALMKVFDDVPDQPEGTPTFIAAETIKGRGVSFMEGTAAWHGGCPTEEQMKQVTLELGGGTL
jgi:transketolase